jgi:phage-related tail protein
MPIAVRDNATEMDSVSQSEDELKNRLVELTRKLDEAKRSRKAMMKKMGDEIKDIEFEIKETMMLMDGQKEAE